VRKFCILFMLAITLVLLTSTSSLANSTIYTVKSGDSLWKIAAENGTTVQQLMELNQLKSDRLNIGDQLILKAGNQPVYTTAASVSASTGIYTVQSGDCLSVIAQRYGTTADKLIQLNQLNSTFLQVGQTLKVPGSNITDSNSGGAVSQAPAAAVAEVANDTVYIVQSGDCLGAIAQRYSMSTSQLMSINQLNSDLIYPGQKLQVAAGAGTASATAGSEVSRSGSAIDGQRVLEVAKQYLGVPYAYGGTSPSGFDCSGFVQYVYKQCGYSLSRTAAGQYQQGIAVSKSELMVGDLVFFACNGGGIDHSGIYAGDNRFIHSSSPRSGGVIYTALSESYYSTSYVGARRIIR